MMLCRDLEHWDLLTGRKIEKCQIAPYIRLSAFALCAASGILVALDQQGSLMAWQLCSGGEGLKGLREHAFAGLPPDLVKPMYLKRNVVAGEAQCRLVMSGGEEVWLLVRDANEGPWSWLSCSPRTGDVETIATGLDIDATDAFMVDADRLMLVSWKNQVVVAHRSQGWVRYELGKTDARRKVKQKERQLVKVCNGLAIGTDTAILLWNMHSDSTSQIQLPRGRLAASPDGSMLVHCDKTTTSFINVAAAKIVGTRTYHKKCRRLNAMALTSDGAYLLHLSNGRDLRLIRTADQRLLAEYFMYSDCDHMALSKDDAYVCVSTMDRRLYVLLIADPDVPAHRERLQGIRDASPKLSAENVNRLLDMMDSDDEGGGEVDVVAWSDATSEINMDEGPTSQLQRRSTVALPSHAGGRGRKSRAGRSSMTARLDKTDDGGGDGAGAGDGAGDGDVDAASRSESRASAKLSRNALEKKYTAKSLVFASHACAGAPEKKDTTKSQVFASHACALL